MDKVTLLITPRGIAALWLPLHLAIAGLSAFLLAASTFVFWELFYGVLLPGNAHPDPPQVPADARGMWLDFGVYAAAHAAIFFYALAALVAWAQRAWDTEELHARVNVATLSVGGLVTAGIATDLAVRWGHLFGLPPYEGSTPPPALISLR
jgi:hypothetical protein